jgi:hypothetical protein
MPHYTTGSSAMSGWTGVCEVENILLDVDG